MPYFVVYLCKLINSSLIMQCMIRTPHHDSKSSIFKDRLKVLKKFDQPFFAENLVPKTNNVDIYTH